MCIRFSELPVFIFFSVSLSLWRYKGKGVSPLQGKGLQAYFFVNENWTLREPGFENYKKATEKCPVSQEKGNSCCQETEAGKLWGNLPCGSPTAIALSPTKNTIETCPWLWSDCTLPLYSIASISSVPARNKIINQTGPLEQPSHTYPPWPTSLWPMAQLSVPTNVYGHI